MKTDLETENERLIEAIHKTIHYMEDLGITAMVMPIAMLKDALYKPAMCRRCGAPMTDGLAIEQTYTGVPDFPGGTIVTISPGGPGKLGTCKKCTHCGWSTT